MLLPVPALADYGLNPETGFLPADPPLRCLPPAYASWEAIISNLHPLLLSRRLREAVQAMPLLSTDHLQSEPEWRRAYVVLAFMLHAYVWGGDRPADRIPANLSIPLLKVCDHLELPPVATYAGVVLWNYRPVFPDEPADSLSNLATLCTFTGSLDEQWFYLVSVAMEARGARTLPLMLDAIRAAREDEAERVREALQEFAAIVSEICDLLEEMYRNCHPHAFYHGFRPYLAGSRNMAEAGLPRGILYEDGSGREEYRQYGGGSNAQSSLIQFFDIVLGVEHRPTGESAAAESSSPDSEDRSEGPRARHNFIMDMRSYMPGPHRRFIEHVSSVANIREYVDAHRENHDLVFAFDAALAMVRALRQKHLQMVTRYIIVKSRETRDQAHAPAANRSSTPQPMNTVINLANVNGSSDRKLRGTGGTALIEFLKQARDETGEPAIGSWARSILNASSKSSSAASRAAAGRKRMVAHAPATAPSTPIPTVGEHADGKIEVVGLAGSWSLDTSEGGLCHW
ncbi:hypothetical protein VTO42DRAFT_6184 [Malbranchea cinnamomea]